jgi:hypothetical protein
VVGGELVAVAGTVLAEMHRPTRPAAKPYSLTVAQIP